MTKDQATADGMNLSNWHVVGPAAEEGDEAEWHRTTGGLNYRQV